HEMVHVYFFSRGNKTEHHGPAFQAVLRRLSEQRAFAGTFATPDDKARLRNELASEKLRLNVESQALDTVREKLRVIRYNVGRNFRNFSEEHQDWFNQRVSAFNARSARFNDDVAAYNANVKRYNLMMSYPDGLDAEWLPRLSLAR